METLEELVAKKDIYAQQLLQVKDLLALDPENSQFLQLQNDLTKVIKLTEDLVSKAATVASIPAQSISSSSTVAAAPTIAVNDKTDGDNDEEEYDPTALETSDGTDAVKDSHEAPTKPTEESATGDYNREDALAIRVGESVEVSGGDRLYAGVVTKKITDTEYQIKYFEYDAEVSLPVSSLSRIEPPPLGYAFALGEVIAGTKVESKYATDGNWYPAVVTAVTPFGANVTYTQYNHSEEVPFYYLRRTAESFAATAAAGKGKKKQDDLPAIIPIPDKLKILPTDTEEEKNRKKKKIKAIKNKNRIVEKETEQKVVQQNWQKFVHKGAKRSLAGLNKGSSMFSSEGAAKVGVVGSGKGMTTFSERKKYKFSTDGLT